MDAHLTAHVVVHNIMQGHIAVMNDDTEMLALLGKGGFFGELALLATARRTAQVIWQTHMHA